MIVVTQEIIDNWDYWNQMMEAEVKRVMQQMLEWEQWLEDDAEPSDEAKG